MSSYECSQCGKYYAYQDSLKRHIKAKHSRDRRDEIGSVGSKTKNRFGNVTCDKCGQVFESQKHLVTHIRYTNHIQFEQYPCMYCVKVFPTQEALENHFYHIHSFSKGRIAHHKSNITYHHPFTMIVAGPTRSGKTSWVVNLLKNRMNQIKPTPSRIVYCYMHWQPMYDELEQIIPSIEWGDGLPTEETFSTFPNSIVVLDDLMDGIVNDSKMMKVFTEGSHHQNISVIFMTQNIFHPGKKARTILLNTQYMVLFKNPRDRQQIKTLARQMYPDDWLNFMKVFKKETDKPYGKLIIDLRPNVLEKDRFLKERDCEHDSSTSSIKSDNLTMEQMYSNQLRQQRETLRYEDPYKLKAIDSESKMNKLLKSNIPENIKSARYNELLTDYQFMMSKSKSQLSNSNPMNLTVYPNPTVSIKNAPNIEMNETDIKSTSAVTPKLSNYDTPSLALRQLTPPSSLLRPEETPLISFSEIDKRKEKAESVSPVPESPTSSNERSLPVAYPSPSRRDIRDDEGDPQHKKSFVSLSDEEETRLKKKRRSDFQLKKRIIDKKNKAIFKKPFDDQQAKSSKGYFVKDVKPHQIPLPSDSSDDTNDESKSYNPDVYPEGTFQDIREDIGDAHHTKSFVSLSDEEGVKERKQRRSDYKFRKRVSKKRKNKDKPY